MRLGWLALVALSCGTAHRDARLAQGRGPHPPVVYEHRLRNARCSALGGLEKVKCWLGAGGGEGCLYLSLHDGEPAPAEEVCGDVANDSIPAAQAEHPTLASYVDPDVSLEQDEANERIAVRVGTTWRIVYVDEGQALAMVWFDPKSSAFDWSLVPSFEARIPAMLPVVSGVQAERLSGRLRGGGERLVVEHLVTALDAPNWDSLFSGLGDEGKADVRRRLVARLDNRDPDLAELRESTWSFLVGRPKLQPADFTARIERLLDDELDGSDLAPQGGRTWPIDELIRRHSARVGELACGQVRRELVRKWAGEQVGGGPDTFGATASTWAVIIETRTRCPWVTMDRSPCTLTCPHQSSDEAEWTSELCTDTHVEEALKLWRQTLSAGPLTAGPQLPGSEGAGSLGPSGEIEVPESEPTAPSIAALIYGASVIQAPLSPAAELGRQRVLYQFATPDGGTVEAGAECDGWQLESIQNAACLLPVTEHAFVLNRCRVTIDDAHRRLVLEGSGSDAQ